MFGDEEKKAKVKEELTPILDKVYGIVEGLCPDEGFVNGLDFPTKADLAILNMIKGYMPYGWGIEATEYDFPSKHPKMWRIATSAAAAEGVKEYLESDEATLETNPFA